MLSSNKPVHTWSRTSSAVIHNTGIVHNRDLFIVMKARELQPCEEWSVHGCRCETAKRPGSVQHDRRSDCLCLISHGWGGEQEHMKRWQADEGLFVCFELRQRLYDIMDSLAESLLWGRRRQTLSTDLQIYCRKYSIESKSFCRHTYTHIYTHTSLHSAETWRHGGTTSSWLGGVCLESCVICF